MSVILMRARKGVHIEDGFGNLISEKPGSYEIHPALFTHIRNGDAELVEIVKETVVEPIKDTPVAVDSSSSKKEIK